MSKEIRKLRELIQRERDENYTPVRSEDGYWLEGFDEALELVLNLIDSKKYLE